MDDSASQSESRSELPSAKSRTHRIPGVGRLAEGEARKVLLPAEGDELPTEVALCRVGGRLFAVDSLCPHEGGRLAAGPLVEGRYLSCPLHLYKFDPESGAAIDVPCPPARTYSVREIEGVAEVTLEA